MPLNFTWENTLYQTFLFTGLFSFVVSLLTSGNTSFNAYLGGFISLSVFLVIVIINLVVKANISLLSLFPFIYVLATIVVALYFYIVNSQKIKDGHISSSFHAFNTLIIILFGIQFYGIYNDITSDKFKLTLKLSQLNKSITCLLSLIETIFISINVISLTYYSTDGFTLLNL